MITPERAQTLIKLIREGRNQLNDLIETAACEGLSVTVDTRTTATGQYFYKLIDIHDPKIDLD